MPAYESTDTSKWGTNPPDRAWTRRRGGWTSEWSAERWPARHHKRQRRAACCINNVPNLALVSMLRAEFPSPCLRLASMGYNANLPVVVHRTGKLLSSETPGLPSKS